MKFYYFTRSGRSRTVAMTMAKEKNQEAEQITDKQNWDGVRGFFKGGKMSALKEQLEINFTPPAEGETVVISFPIWAGSFPPAVRSFVDAVGKERIIAVPTAMSSKLKGTDREGFLQVIDLTGKELKTPSAEELLEK